MYDDLNKTICNIICLIIFSLTIVFFKNIYAFLLLGIFFFVFTKNKKANNLVILLYVLTILGFILNVVNENNFLLLKLIIILDYVYYYCNDLDLLYVSSENSNVKRSVNIREVQDKFDSKMEKSLLLTNDEIEMLNSNFLDKVDDVIDNEMDNKYIRFDNKKRKSLNFSFNCSNGLYIAFHLFLLLICVVVS